MKIYHNSLSVGNNLFLNATKFAVAQHIGASVEVEFEQINNDSQSNDEMEADNPVEYLHDDDPRVDNGDGMNQNGTPTTNETFVWENKQNFVEQQYDEGHGERYGSIVQISSSATFIQYGICTENIRYIPETVQMNTNEYSGFTPDEDSQHRRTLVMAAIEQLDNENVSQERIHQKNQEHGLSPLSIQSDDITQSGDVTTTADFHMDIQAEVNVETTGTKAKECSENDVGPMLDESEIPSRPKRRRKVVPAYASYMERCKGGKNASDVKATPKPTPPSDVPTNDSKEVLDVKQLDCKLAKAKEKRKSAARKTISGARSKILDDIDKVDEAKASVSTISGKNCLYEFIVN